MAEYSTIPAQKNTVPSRMPLEISLRPSLPAVVLLLLTFLGAFAASLYKRIWIDELLEYYTDTQPVRAILHTQLHHPFSLEPPTFHLIVHGFQTVLGPTLQAQRLPSMLCFLLAQYCIFCIVRAFAGDRAALIGLLLPTLTYARHYADEGRSYALLIAMGTSSLLCWYLATQQTPLRRRVLSLLGLVVSLGLAITSHYYGLLLLGPLYLAELVRTFERRRPDWPVIAALLCGGATILLDVPFSRAALTFKAHYYAQIPTPQVIWTTYEWLLAIVGANLFIAIPVLLLVGVSAFLSAWYVIRARVSDSPVSAWTAPIALTLLPVFAFFLSRFATHAFEPRYTLPALGGLSIVVALAISPMLTRKPAYYAILGLVLLASLGLAVREIKRCHREYAVFRQQIQLPSALVDGRGLPVETIYVRSVESFLLAHFYLPPATADRFTLLYSMNLEYGWLHRDAASHFAQDIGQTIPQFHTLPYEQFRALSGPHSVLVTDGKYVEVDEWLDKQLQADHFQLQTEGPFLLGMAYRATPAPGVLP
jgi:4-amino-4-deoxy-L-arabinose transferase-like glycosyltransferase